MTHERLMNELDGFYGDISIEDMAEEIADLIFMGRDNRHCDQVKEDLTDAIYDLKDLATDPKAPNYQRQFFLALVDIAARKKDGTLNI